jgi:Zn finger protein HypA/HybF involved in hydrogenase expression
METARPENLLDIDTLIENFLTKSAQGIRTIHRVYFKNTDELSIRALVTELMDELRTGAVTFFNKGSPVEELDSYLFYIVNAYCKQKAKPVVKKKTEYLCPGCLYLGAENLVAIVNGTFRCDDCEEELKQTSDPKKIAFYRTFFKHNRSGYHCEQCDRFIPHPLDDSPIISCPYYDCCFVGSWLSLKRMHHPTSESNAEILTLDTTMKNGGTFKDAVASQEVDALSRLEIEQELNVKIDLIKSVIDYQSNNVPYNSSDFTVKHKYLVYQAYNNLLKKDPAPLVDYLLNNSRSGGFQHKIFQEYIRLLEESLPFSFKKNNKHFKIESLLDTNLNLFDGMSVFETIVTDKLTLKNETKEHYTGGRKGTISRPFYIGKLLAINEKKSKTPLIDHVVEYTFSKIKVRDIVPGTEVIVTHLRVPPHYQMGGMVYINRIRKKIVDRANLLLSKSIDE